MLLFGSEADNRAALRSRVSDVANAQQAIADFVDRLPADQFDKKTFRPLPSMPQRQRRQIDALLYRYQQERSAQKLAKSRLRLVHQMQRRNAGGDLQAPDINPDLLLGQMFGARPSSMPDSTRGRLDRAVGRCPRGLSYPAPLRWPESPT